jgi:hypothetical protein
MSLSREEIFAAWAPADSRWSAWAKPVLFAHVFPPDETSLESVDLPPVTALPRPRDTAIVVDLPGRTSAWMGLALARAGYQPVPLYNSGGAMGALVDMDSIATILGWGAYLLKKLKRPPETPPVFLLNADRLDNSASSTAPGRYDNRWAVVPQDMPSADFLKAAGINHVVVVSNGISDDLAHILYRYQEAKLDVKRTPGGEQGVTPVTVAKPGAYKSLWYRMGVFAGLRRNSAGGFGGMTPDVNSSGGGGFAG